MAVPTPIDSKIETDKPAEESVTKEGFRDSDRYNWSEAPNGGAGIAPNVIAFLAAFGAHRHNGNDAQGAKIGEGGLADGAASDSDMFQDESVDDTNVASNTMQEINFDNGSCLVTKLEGDLGYHYSGTKDWVYDDPPEDGVDDIFLGDVVKLTNHKGSKGVITTQTHSDSLGDYFIRQVTDSVIRLGLRKVWLEVGPGQFGTGAFDFILE